MIRRALAGLLGAAALAFPGAAGAQMSLANPPPGANDFNCRPSAAHPDPVVLVHGLGATMGENWSYLSPRIAAQGYCVFALTYGIDPRAPEFGGVLPVEQSARELGDFVARVRAATGAQRVDLVGHSEGTFMPEWWLKFDGGARYVGRYVAMTPLYRGTHLLLTPELRDLGYLVGVGAPVIDAVSAFCGSCPEFLAGSPTVRAIDSGPGGAAVPGIAYTTIPTRYDELVVPYWSGILHAPNARNVVLQSVNPLDFSEHALEAFDPTVARIVLDALARPARSEFTRS